VKGRQSGQDGGRQLAREIRALLETRSEGVDADAHATDGEGGQVDGEPAQHRRRRRVVEHVDDLPRREVGVCASEAAADGVEDAVLKVGHLQLVGEDEELEVDERDGCGEASVVAAAAAAVVIAAAEVFARQGVDCAFVDPTDNEVEDFGRVVHHAEGGGGGFHEGPAEGGAEEGRAVAEQRLVHLIVVPRRAHVYINHTAGEEPESVSVTVAWRGMARYLLTKVPGGFRSGRHCIDSGERLGDIVRFRRSLRFMGLDAVSPSF